MSVQVLLKPMRDKLTADVLSRRTTHRTHPPDPNTHNKHEIGDPPDLSWRPAGPDLATFRTPAGKNTNKRLLKNPKISKTCNDKNTETGDPPDTSRRPAEREPPTCCTRSGDPLDPSRQKYKHAAHMKTQ